MVVVTSLLDHKLLLKSEIQALYRRRWLAELELRDIKLTMQLDILRRLTPAAVRCELWTGIPADNLVRQSMLQSAMAGEALPTTDFEMIGQTIVSPLIEPLGLLWLGPCCDVIPSPQLSSLSEVSGSHMVKTHHEFDTQLLQMRENDRAALIPSSFEERRRDPLRAVKRNKPNHPGTSHSVTSIADPQ